MQIKYFSGYFRNRRSLCEELGLECDIKDSGTDLRVTAAAWEKWHTDMPAHLHGPFAIVFHDETEHMTYAFRDQLGQKQLFYAYAGQELLFSGDILEIAKDPRVGTTLNEAMLQRYLHFGFPIGEETFFRGIKKLPPGHFLCSDGEKACLTCYWRPYFKPEHDRSDEEWAGEIHSVVRRLIAEETEISPVCRPRVLLSGGVDSSYLLSMTDSDAFVAGYSEAAFDESPLSRRTAQIFGRDVKVRSIEPGEYFAHIPEVMRMLGQPVADASNISLSLCIRSAADDAPVIISGEGADEFFAGYLSYEVPMPEDGHYWTCSRLMVDDEIRPLLKRYDVDLDISDVFTPIWRHVEPMEPLSGKQAIDISFWLDGNIYYNTDRISQGYKATLHAPLSDLRLFELASAIPADRKLKNGLNKYVFRLAASGVLPEEIAFRPKKGFPVPVREWMADERYNGPVRSLLFGELSSHYFNRKELQSLWEECQSPERIHWFQVYMIYVFLVWAETVLVRI